MAQEVHGVIAPVAQKRWEIAISGQNGFLQQVTDGHFCGDYSNRSRGANLDVTL
jgi:hypothetical protein